MKNYTNYHTRNNSKNLIQKSKKRAKLKTFNTHIHVHRRDFINRKANGTARKFISRIVETGNIDPMNRNVHGRYCISRNENGTAPKYIYKIVEMSKIDTLNTNIYTEETS